MTSTLSAMRVQFDYTQDDLVDASKRFLARSKAVRRWRWQGLIMLAAVGWVATFAFFYRSPTIGVWVGLVVAALCIVLYPILYESSLERRLRRIVKENHGDSKVFVCEVELAPEGLSVSGHNIRTTTDWKEVKEILVTSDTVDIFTNSGGGVIVRDRAFKSPQERQQFIDLARSYLDLGRQGLG
ncbi:MAG: YcxB family protein [Acidobacteriota bacterium]